MPRRLKKRQGLCQQNFAPTKLLGGGCWKKKVLRAEPSKVPLSNSRKFKRWIWIIHYHANVKPYSKFVEFSVGDHIFSRGLGDNSCWLFIHLAMSDTILHYPWRIVPSAGRIASAKSALHIMHQMLRLVSVRGSTIKASDYSEEAINEPTFWPLHS